MSNTGATIQLVSRSSKNDVGVLCSPSDPCSPSILGLIGSSMPNPPTQGRDEDEDDSGRTRT
jgi:hypothetical protein